MNYKTISIKINNYEDIMKLVKFAQIIAGDITIKKDKYIVNGKSIMGVLSLNLATGADIEFPIDDAFSEFFEKFLTPFKI